MKTVGGVCLLLSLCLILAGFGGQEPSPSSPAPVNSLPRSVPAPTRRPLFTGVSNNTLLGWASLLVQNVKPGATSYQHKSGPIAWAGQGGAEAYLSQTDCSGLINALLVQSFGLRQEDFQAWLNNSRPLAETYYKAIISNHGFMQIEQVNQVQPGDLIAIRYPPGYGGDNTGHIMVVAGIPQAHQPSKPEIKGTEQWSIPVIDQSESGHGPKDTRYKEDGTFRDGLGQGTFRLYTRSSGQATGYSWSEFANSEYYDQATRPFAIGRLDANFSLIK